MIPLLVTIFLGLLCNLWRRQDSLSNLIESMLNILGCIAYLLLFLDLDSK